MRRSSSATAGSSPAASPTTRPSSTCCSRRRASSPPPASCRSTCASRSTREEEVGGHSIVDWVERGRAARRRGARPRRRLCDRDAAVVLHRAARHLLLPRHRPHGRARPPLGHVRRRGAQRDARADADARRRAPGATAACPSRCARASSRPPTRSSPAGACCRRAPRSSRRTARARTTHAPRRSSTCARRPSRRSTVNGIESGSPRLQKTVLPVEARANVSIRLAPGQTTGGDRARVRAPAPRGRARGRDRRRRALVDGRARLRRPRRARDRARAGRVRARARHPAGARPLGRLDPGRARARRARRARDRHRLRASDGAASTRRTSTSRSRPCATGSRRRSRCSAGFGELG